MQCSERRLYTAANTKRGVFKLPVAWMSPFCRFYLLSRLARVMPKLTRQLWDKAQEVQVHLSAMQTIVAYEYV